MQDRREGEAQCNNGLTTIWPAALTSAGIAFIAAGVLTTAVMIL
jgi:hypothetical protein